MKLNLPSMKKTKNVNTTGEHGPDKPDVRPLPLVSNHEHTKTINPLNYVSIANEFGEDVEKG